MCKRMRLGIFPNLDKEKVRLALPDFINTCREWDLEPLLPSDLQVDFECAAFDRNNTTEVESLDAAVSLGGDGTLLQMAHYVAVAEVPAFGINFGRLGFLAEIDLPGMTKAISKLAQHNYTVENRSMLQAEIVCGGKVDKTIHALNDLVFTKGVIGKMAHLQMYINGKPSGRYMADGLIVATATGSTAYSLSAGGPLVMPELEVSVINPICAHSLTARTLVVPITECIELKSLSDEEESILTADGQRIAKISQGAFVRIKKSCQSMRLIRLIKRDYYQTWQQKLTRNI